MTAFTEIYDVMFSQITDPVFLANDTSDELKERYLLNSIPRFKKCKTNLVLRDMTAKEFAEDLTDEEKLILGTLMVVEYLKPQITSLENIKQALSNRDFNLSSQAAHLDQLRKLRDDTKADAARLIVDYTYNNGTLDDLK